MLANSGCPVAVGIWGFVEGFLLFLQPVPQGPIFSVSLSAYDSSHTCYCCLFQCPEIFKTVLSLHHPLPLAPDVVLDGPSQLFSLDDLPCHLGESQVF